jgi:hypothetical protein
MHLSCTRRRILAGILGLCGGCFLASCGDDATPSQACSALNCSGCCVNGVCNQGDKDALCGKSGFVCIACQSGTSCKNQQCQSSVCYGCVDLVGTCQQGNTSAVCGSNGGACSACPVGQTCTAGVCQGACSFQTCADGCCSPTGCQTPSNDQHCGLKGGMCNACLNGDTCVLGQCTKNQGDCTNCQGCCYQNKCVEETSASACGPKGGTCVQCNTGDICENGACKTPQKKCSPSSCKTCCTSENDCLPDTQLSEAACGNGGEACHPCGGNDKCLQGQCIYDQPCFSYCKDGCCTPQGQCVGYTTQTTTQCGKGGSPCAGCGTSLSCLDGDCVTDPVWDIWVLSAKIADKDPDGDNWDSSFLQSPLPDPYALIAINNPQEVCGDTGCFDVYDQHSNDTIDDTITPSWSSPPSQGKKVWSFKQSDLLTYGLYLEIMDSDAPLTPDLAGECFYKPATIPTGMYEIATCGIGVTQLRIQFIKQ